MAADRTGYKKVNWVNKQTALGATNLGQMDEGIKKNSDLAIECANYIDEIHEAFINQLNISYDSDERVFVLTIGSAEGQNPTTRFNAVKAFDTQSLVIGDICDDLDSDDSGKVLSAKQGKVLDGKITDLASTVSGHTATLQAKADLVDGKVAADQLPLAYFDKFVSGENIDAQIAEGQLAYCYAGSIYVGGNVPSTVVIRFTQTANKAIYLKRIYVKYVNAEEQEIEYEHIFTAKEFTENNQTQELDGLNWLLKDSNNITYFKYVNDYGLQIGSGTVGIRNCAISTVDLAGCTIKEVQVNACGATGTACKVSVEAAGDHWLYDEGGSSEASEFALVSNDTTSVIAFTYGEGSVPGTGSLVEYSDTFVKKEDGELVTFDSEARTVYINLENKRIYIKMSGTLVEISKVLELGSDATTAYRGDYGNQNYTNIQNILSGETSFAGQKTFAAIKSPQSVEESDDLANKAYVDSAITAVKANAFQVVQALPNEGADGVIYLVPVANTNYYTQYIWENSGWLNIGDTQIDLSGKADLSNGKVSMSQLYDVEIVTYSSTPLTALQLEKAKKGKLAIAVTNVSGLTAFTAVICLFAGDYDANNYRFDGIFTLSTGGSYVPKKLFISNFAIKVNKTTGAFDQSGNNFNVISDDNDNFFSSSTDPTSSGKRIVREQNVYNKLLPPIQSVLGDRVLKVGSQNTQAEWATEIKPMVDTTWADLKALRDAGNLIPGQQYRITDYQCTTTTTNTSSAGHQFDIIVTADNANTLNENARACLHNGDTYFANCKLEAWKLKYCLDNDTNRFLWADSTNGKGVIYRMIDEFYNDVPYDFKNILFTRSGAYTNAYTFSSSANNDASLSGLAQKCTNNVMKEYFNTSKKQQLNFNVFYSTASDLICYDNTFGNDCRNNTFDRDCYNNTFGNGCHSNIFGNYCYSNTFGDSCLRNTFGNYCYSNTFGNNCYDNTFSDECYSNTFSDECYSNTFGNSCYYNTFSTNCFSNTFGNSCRSNTFGNSCRSNTFGNSCRSNTFDDNCSYIIFGDSSSTINYCTNMIIDRGCSYLYINSTDTDANNSNYLQNVHIHLGVEGSSSSNRTTITIPDRALDYETAVYPTNSQTILV